MIWSTGIEASSVSRRLEVPIDQQGRIVVEPDLTIPGHPNAFVAGDQARLEQDGRPLPSMAPVAVQEGQYAARTILRDIQGKARAPFRFVDKGKMATIGRNRAIMQSGRWKLGGRAAWFGWLLVHIYYLTGFRNRLLVVAQWAWSYITYRRGARLIVGKEWRSTGLTADEKSAVGGAGDNTPVNEPDKTSAKRSGPPSARPPVAKNS